MFNSFNAFASDLERGLLSATAELGLCRPGLFSKAPACAQVDLEGLEGDRRCAEGGGPGGSDADPKTELS